MSAQGEAYRKAGNPAEAQRAVNRISEIDPDAFAQDPDCAGLKASLLKKTNAAEAEQVYRAALIDNPDSAYLHDNDRTSIEGGLRAVQTALAIPEDQFALWLIALYGRDE